MSTIFDATEVFQLALRIEENGEKFYRKMAEKFEDAEIKELFTFLADEEVGHKKFYNQLLKEFEAYEPPSESAVDYYEYIQSYADDVMFNDKEFDENISKINDLMSALNFAINSELHTVLYFSEMKMMVPKNKQDKIDDIIEEERKHFVKLSEMKKQRSKKK